MGVGGRVTQRCRSFGGSPYGRGGLAGPCAAGDQHQAGRRVGRGPAPRGSNRQTDLTERGVAPLSLPAPFARRVWALFWAVPQAVLFANGAIVAQLECRGRVQEDPTPRAKAIWRNGRWGPDRIPGPKSDFHHHQIRGPDQTSLNPEWVRGLSLDRKQTSSRTRIEGQKPLYESILSVSSGFGPGGHSGPSSDFGPKSNFRPNRICDVIKFVDNFGFMAKIELWPGHRVGAKLKIWTKTNGQ